MLTTVLHPPTLNSFQVLGVVILILYYVQEGLGQGVLIAYDSCFLSKQVKLLFSATIDFAIIQQHPGSNSGQRKRICHGAPPLLMCSLKSLPLTVVDNNTK